MINWLKHFVWFIKESRSFMDYNTLQVFIHGGLKKGIHHANQMVNWDKMTLKQRETWYLSGEGRTWEVE